MSLRSLLFSSMVLVLLGSYPSVVASQVRLNEDFIVRLERSNPKDSVSDTTRERGLELLLLRLAALQQGHFLRSGAFSVDVPIDTARLGRNRVQMVLGQSWLVATAMARTGETSTMVMWHTPSQAVVSTTLTGSDP